MVHFKVHRCGPSRAAARGGAPQNHVQRLDQRLREGRAAQPHKALPEKNRKFFYPIVLEGKTCHPTTDPTARWRVRTGSTELSPFRLEAIIIDVRWTDSGLIRY